MKPGPFRRHSRHAVFSTVLNDQPSFEEAVLTFGDGACVQAEELGEEGLVSRFGLVGDGETPGLFFGRPEQRRRFGAQAVAHLVCGQFEAGGEGLAAVLALYLLEADHPLRDMFAAGGAKPAHSSPS